MCCNFFLFKADPRNEGRITPRNGRPTVTDTRFFESTSSRSKFGLKRFKLNSIHADIFEKRLAFGLFDVIFNKFAAGHWCLRWMRTIFELKTACHSEVSERFIDARARRSKLAVRICRFNMHASRCPLISQSVFFSATPRTTIYSAK